MKQSHMSTCKYFKDQCSDGEQSKTFWHTVRPYMSDKGETHYEIRLYKDDKIISDPGKVARIFNNYFMTVTDVVGITENTNGLSLPEIIKINTNAIQG